MPPRRENLKHETKTGHTALRSLRVGWATKECGCVQLVGLALCWLLPLAPHVSFLFSAPLSSNGPSDSHSGRAPTTHIMDPYTANHQAAQGSKVARGKKNTAFQILHSRLPRFPRLGLSDLTTRLSTHSGDRYQVNCVRSSSCVSITATSEIPLSPCLVPLPLAQKWTRRTLENSRIFMPCCP